MRVFSLFNKKKENYFKLNKENAKDGRDHYFYFKVMKEK